MAKPRLLSVLDEYWLAGMKTQAFESIVSVSTAPTALVSLRGNRFRLTLCNLGANQIQIASTTGFSSQGGIILATGVTLVILALDDGDAVTYPYEAVASAGTSNVYVREEFLIQDE